MPSLSDSEGDADVETAKTTTLAVPSPAGTDASDSVERVAPLPAKRGRSHISASLVVDRAFT